MLAHDLNYLDTHCGACRMSRERANEPENWECDGYFEFEVASEHMALYRRDVPAMTLRCYPDGKVLWTNLKY